MADDVKTTDAPETRAEERIKTFDFRLPHRLSRTQLRTFQAIHDGFAESFASYLGSRLQTSVTITSTGVAQRFYSEYGASITSPSCLYVFRMAGPDAAGALDMSPELALTMVEHLMGGVAGADRKVRALTKIEQSILRGIILRALAELQRAWEVMTPVTVSLERFESDKDFLQLAPASEIVVLVSFSVSIGDTPHRLTLCFPTFALEEALVRISGRGDADFYQAGADQGWREVLAQQLGTTAIEATSVLGETRLRLRDIVQLETGDVIKTDIPISGNVRVQIGGKDRFVGRPGISNGKVAVRITGSTDHSGEESNAS
jgi:flagellar motor switch protein FliM